MSIKDRTGAQSKMLHVAILVIAEQVRVSLQARASPKRGGTIPVAPGHDRVGGAAPFVEDRVVV